jgi:hypothetical protein
MKKQLLLLLVIVFGSLFTAVNPAFAQNWTPIGPPNISWESIASSSDGSKLAAISEWLSSYTSTNYGITWFEQSNPVGYPLFLFAVALSADGNKLAATSLFANPGAVFTSTNGGINWVSNSVPGSNFIAIASSADGNRLVTVVGATPSRAVGPVVSGPIFLSTNSGVTWEHTSAPDEIWSCVASSADGTRLAAATIGLTPEGYPAPGMVYVSHDSGATWLQTSAPTNNAWAAIACSADGTKIVAAGTSIYSSTNSGLTWVSNNVPVTFWQAVTVSADGSKWAAVDQFGRFYNSTNLGASWTSNSIPESISAMAASADGNRLVVVNFWDGGMYVSQTTPAPLLNIAQTEGGQGLSWLIPSTNFVLQQNHDLSTTNWVTVTNSPTLNLTNLQDEVVLSPANNSGFYRLATP